MNVVSFFPFKEKHYLQSGCSFFCSFMQNEISLSLYIYRFFHILQISYEIKKYIPMRIWPYASLSLHVTDLETMYLSRLSEYGTEENLDWVYAIWFWPVLHLTLLVVFRFLLYFHLLRFDFPSHHGLCSLPFVLKLAVSLLDLFYSVQATKQSIQIEFYVTRGKTSDRCLFCFSG